MTMTQEQRVPLARYLVSVRRDWDLAGTDAALVKLNQQVGDPFEVAAIANAAARNLTNRYPIVMTLDGPHRHRPDNTPPDGTPRHQRRDLPPCEHHGGTTTRGHGGPYVCCWQAEQEAQAAERLTDRTEPT